MTPPMAGSLSIWGACGGHRQLNAFTCSFLCSGPERTTHFQWLRTAGEYLKTPESGLNSVKLTVPVCGRAHDGVGMPVIKDCAATHCLAGHIRYFTARMRFGSPKLDGVSPSCRGGSHARKHQAFAEFLSKERQDRRTSGRLPPHGSTDPVMP
jgi:hypothetical protein